MNRHFLIATLCLFTAGAALAVSAPTRPENAKLVTTASSAVNVYELGAVDGVPAFALAIKPDGNTPNVCSSHKVLIQAPGDAFSNQRASALFNLAAQRLFQLCGGKVLMGKQPRDSEPRLRDAVMGEWLDAAGFQAVLAQQNSKTVFTQRVELVSPAPARNDEWDERQKTQLRTMTAMAEANLPRLRSLFGKYKIDAWVPLADLAKNPFAWSGKTVLSAARPQRAMSESEMAVSDPRARGYDAASLVLTSASAGQWNDDSRLVVLQPGGRYQDKADQAAVAKLLESLPCKEVDCQDLLLIPGPPAKPGMPALRVLTSGEKL